MTLNNPNEIDTKEEMTVHIIKIITDFLKKHWWKVILLIISIGLAFVPFIWIEGGLAGIFK